MDIYWKIIESLKWEGNHKRCAQKLKQSYSKEDRDNLSSVVDNLMSDLHTRFKADWLAKIPASDDAWSDIRAEVIGRGQESFNNITVEKLIAMAENTDYNESFLYIFH